MELTAAKVMYKHTIPALFPLITPALTWKVKTTDKALYLTFDDGPHPVITPKVLDILDRHKAKATFFCVGENVKKFPAVFAEITKRGHRVGN
ncbi:MAG: polysaccharide deacetylase family protein, partial [Bacteroidota bacterium]